MRIEERTKTNRTLRSWSALRAFVVSGVRWDG
jgi:hypothetical protein